MRNRLTRTKVRTQTTVAAVACATEGPTTTVQTSTAATTTAATAAAAVVESLDGRSSKGYRFKRHTVMTTTARFIVIRNDRRWSNPGYCWTALVILLFVFFLLVLVVHHVVASGSSGSRGSILSLKLM